MRVNVAFDGYGEKMVVIENSAGVNWNGKEPRWTCKCIHTFEAESQYLLGDGTRYRDSQLISYFVTFAIIVTSRDGFLRNVFASNIHYKISTSHTLLLGIIKSSPCSVQVVSFKFVYSVSRKLDPEANASDLTGG